MKVYALAGGDLGQYFPEKRISYFARGEEHPARIGDERQFQQPMGSNNAGGLSGSAECDRHPREFPSATM
jgi:hypothetical protein